MASKSTKDCKAIGNNIMKCRSCGAEHKVKKGPSGRWENGSWHCSVDCRGKWGKVEKVMMKEYIELDDYTKSNYSEVIDQQRVAELLTCMVSGRKNSVKTVMSKVEEYGFDLQVVLECHRLANLARKATSVLSSKRDFLKK